jgi:hypothetical protein
MPLVANIDAFVIKYSTLTLVPDVDAVLPLVRTVGDAKLEAQLAFLKRVGSFMTPAAELSMAMQQKLNDPAATLIATNVLKVQSLHIALHLEQGAPDVGELFITGGDDLRCDNLDGIVDGDAFLAEIVRQSKKKVSEIVTTWIDVTTQTVAVLDSFCPKGWPHDETLLTSLQHHTALLQNPRYKDIGPVSAAIKATILELRKLNVKPQANLIPKNLIAQWDKVLDTSSVCVKVFCDEAIWAKLHIAIRRATLN